ncbi:MAG: DUF3024 domain-containing protein [Elusimicrobia bacterium]|nr:DUF3024 domain-containing protein [Candidatus Obscuribacterium magneticum]
MNLPKHEKQLANTALARYCKKRIPENVRDKIRLTYRFRGNTATLYETRPPWTGEGDWTELPVAQLRYDTKKKLWTLYCADRNCRWHVYIECHPAKSISTLLEEVEDDPTGIFWG